MLPDQLCTISWWWRCFSVLLHILRQCLAFLFFSFHRSLSNTNVAENFQTTPPLQHQEGIWSSNPQNLLQNSIADRLANTKYLILYHFMPPSQCSYMQSTNVQNPCLRIAELFCSPLLGLADKLTLWRRPFWVVVCCVYAAFRYTVFNIFWWQRDCLSSHRDRYSFWRFSSADVDNVSKQAFNGKRTGRRIDDSVPEPLKRQDDWSSKVESKDNLWRSNKRVNPVDRARNCKFT